MTTNEPKGNEGLAERLLEFVARLGGWGEIIDHMDATESALRIAEAEVKAWRYEATHQADKRQDAEQRNTELVNERDAAIRHGERMFEAHQRAHERAQDAESKLAAVGALAQSWQDEAAASWCEALDHATMQQCCDEIRSILIADAGTVDNDNTEVTK